MKGSQNLLRSAPGAYECIEASFASVYGRVKEINLRVYHFLNAANAIDDLRHRRLKVALVPDLNDPFELLAADARDKAIRGALYREWRRTSSTLGVLCFSRSWRSPLLWAHYADKHRGIALEFEVKKSSVKQISYEPERLEVSLTGAEQLSKDLLQAILTTKYKDWAYEDEVRIVRALGKAAEEGMHFAPFTNDMRLTKVILGVRCEHSSTNIAKQVTIQDAHAAVTKARLAFGSFRVVKNRAVKDCYRPASA